MVLLSALLEVAISIDVEQFMHVLLLSSRSGFSRGENLLKVKGKKENEGRVYIIEKCRSDQSI